MITINNLKTSWERIFLRYNFKIWKWKLVNFFHSSTFFCSDLSRKKKLSRKKSLFSSFFPISWQRGKIFLPDLSSGNIFRAKSFCCCFSFLPLFFKKKKWFRFLLQSKTHNVYLTLAENFKFFFIWDYSKISNIILSWWLVLRLN